MSKHFDLTKLKGNLSSVIQTNPVKVVLAKKTIEEEALEDFA